MRLILAALVGGCLLSTAQAHEAPSGWHYDAACCSNQDCSELPENQTPKPLDGGNWQLTTGEIVERSKVKFSPDGKYHLCRFSSTGGVICLYVPPQGS